MARARNVKPAFFSNEDLAECCPLARILFIGLWCEADREGRLEDRPRRLKIEYLPYEDCDCNSLLDELRSKGFIERYEVDGRKLIWIPKFLRHQRPHHKEAASSLPPPPGNPALTPSKGDSVSDVESTLDQRQANVESTLDQRQANVESTKSLLVPLIPDSGFLIPDSGFLIPDSGFLIPDSPYRIPPSVSEDTISVGRAKKSRLIAHPGFDEFFAAYPKRVDRVAAERAWNKTKPNLVTILADIDARLAAGQWTERQYIPNPATYLNGHRWLDEIPLRQEPPLSRQQQERELRRRRNAVVLGIAFGERKP